MEDESVEDAYFDSSGRDDANASRHLLPVLTAQSPILDLAGDV
jgi:hypothetical protein